ncbi:low affinity potassium transporter [Tulasnella sp. 427]|nr:low affinity potassium transporter [Tulasnella sp. 427]
MPTTEDSDDSYPENSARGPLAWLQANLNFYRIHLTFFTFVPLIFALIFWGSSDKNSDPISFIDSLFIVVSSITVTGLATIDLSPLTTWQQVILLMLMIIGHPITVSWVIVYVRKSYFRRKFGDVIIHRMRERAAKDGMAIPPELEEEVEARAEGPWKYRLTKLLRRGNKKKRSPQASSSRGTSSPGGTGAGSESDSEEHGKSKKHDKHGDGGKVTAHMIRRVDNAPQLVDPSGWISSGHASSSRDRSNSRSQPPMGSPPPGQLTHNIPTRPTASALQPESTLQPAIELQSHPTIDTDGGRSDNLDRATISQLSHQATGPGTANAGYFPRTTTVEFANPPKLTHHVRKGSFLGQNVPPSALATGISAPTIQQQQQGGVNLGSEGSPTFIRRSQSRQDDRRATTFRSGIDMGRTNTMLSSRTRGTMAMDTMPIRNQDRGFGGFPGPLDLIGRLIRKLFPSVEQKITIPRTETLVSNLNTAAGGSTAGGPAPRTVPYLRFDTVVGRNSVFHDLTQEKLEELGGVEYRALSLLMWLVGVYHVCLPLLVFVIIGPYISQPRWRSAFDDQTKYIPPPWFALFQSISAYTNTGTSLCDTSMVPFTQAYAMIFPMFFVIIAGNTGYPIFLRFFIWILTKIVPKNSQINETLHFLLDHPRRCYIYLFPSHQTWFLLTVLLGMVLTDWVSFLVLDIGTPEIMQLPVGTRIAVGLLQAGAVRAAGFAAISLNALAPAVKVLYVTMMYVAVYPIALSVRSTNVYEEQSLGIFEAEPNDEEEHFEPGLAHHLMAKSPDEEPESIKPAGPPAEKQRLDTVHEAPAPSAVQTPATEDPPHFFKGL